MNINLCYLFYCHCRCKNSKEPKRKLTAKRKAESEKLIGDLNKYLKIGNADKEQDEKNAKDDKQETQLEILELIITVETIQPNTTETKEIYYNEELNITDDPASWTEIISKQIIDYLVKKVPPEIILDGFPCQDDGRYFSKVYLKRELSN